MKKLIVLCCMVMVVGVAACRTVKGETGEMASDINEIWKDIKIDESGKWPMPDRGDKLTKGYTYTTDDKKGTVTASGENFPNEGPERAFDHGAGKYCTKSRTMWIQYQYADGKKHEVTAYTITSANDAPGRDPKNWKLLGSNDSEKWDELDTRSDEKFMLRHQKRLFQIKKPGNYKYYKLDVAENHGDELSQLQEIELLIKADVSRKAEKKDTGKPKQSKTSGAPGNLFKDDLSNAQYSEGGWAVEDGVLTAKGRGDIWTKKRYGDFVLELDFKCEKDTNSGVFIRCKSIREWLHTAIEVQILQPDNSNKKHVCGAIFDCLAPSKQIIKKTGEWNHYKITARGSRIEVVLNGEQVIDMDLDKWTEPHKNPDGSRNKFKYAYKDMSREGHIGFQYHGHPIWFRNLRISQL